MKKTLCIVQARTNSLRFPGKVLKKIHNKTLIQLLLERLSICKNLDNIVLATTSEKSDNVLTKTIDLLGYQTFRGSESNVLERFYHTASKYKANTIIRITGDCPLIDPNIVDKIIEYYLSNNFDYVSNTINPTFPDGLDVEVFSFKTLLETYRNAKKLSEKEHVTPYIKNSNNFQIGSYENNENLSLERWTIDYEVDFTLISSIFNYFYPNIYFTMNDILEYKKYNPNIFNINKGIKRNEGSKLSNKKKKISLN